MSKRKKELPTNPSQSANIQPTIAAPHAPAKEPTLLAVSIILFALWFVFLFVTAVFG